MDVIPCALIISRTGRIREGAVVQSLIGLVGCSHELKQKMLKETKIRNAIFFITLFSTYLLKIRNQPAREINDGDLPGNPNL